jgi:hypothetical protein
VKVIQGIDKHRVRYLFCGDWVDNPDGSEDLKTLPNDNLKPLRDYIHSHYRLKKLFSDGTEIWENDAG